MTQLTDLGRISLQVAPIQGAGPANKQSLFGYGQCVVLVLQYVVHKLKAAACADVVGDLEIGLR